MSVPNLFEEPLDRLNYFNSQRLEAVDLRLEQLYHIRVRRWLNKSLYSAGIAAGLEVRKDPADLHSVIVSPGLALDIDGREIIVLEELHLKVCGTPKRPDGVQLGNYLVISYGEEKVAPLQDGCRVVSTGGKEPGASCGCRGSGSTAKLDCGCGCGGGKSTKTAGGRVKSKGGGCGCGGGAGCGCGSGKSSGRDLSWGAPSRIRSEPLLLFQDAWPTDTQRKILLGQVVLNELCQVDDIKSGMRRYATAIKPPNTTPVSIEGEKDIDSGNQKTLRFHIEGGFPDSAILYLQAAKFSSLFYTELGRHTHAINVAVATHPAIGAHQHPLDGVSTNTLGAHTHTVEADIDDSGDGLELDGKDGRVNLTTEVNMSLSNSGDHAHSFDPGTMTGLSGGAGALAHSVTATLANAGVSTATTINTGAARSFVDDLHVSFDGIDITPQILAQLQAINALAWAELGDGTGTHEIVTNGTGPIDLRQLGVDLSPGKHTLEFRVNSGGGQILYNLYVS